MTPFRKLSNKQYQDLDAIINGHEPDDPWPLYWEGLIESIDNNKSRWKLTREGRRQYTYHREHQLLSA